MFYRARWYDPALGRFAQADSIIPGAGNPQAWDRYAYALNDPVRYSDPSGHMVICGVADEGCGSNSTQPPPGGEDSDDSDDSPVTIDIPNWLDDWLWDNIPSAFGIHFGVSGQVDTGIGVGYTPSEIQVIFNWRTGQLSIFYSAEAFGYVGTPNLFGGNVYGGYTTVKGLSDNQIFEGPSLFGGLTTSLDGVAKGGGSLISGMALVNEQSMELPPEIFIDPGSGRPIEYHQVSLTLGGNLIPNAVDGGLMVGNAYSIELISESISFWPDLR